MSGPSDNEGTPLALFSIDALSELPTQCQYVKCIAKDVYESCQNVIPGDQVRSHTMGNQIAGKAPQVLCDKHWLYYNQKSSTIRVQNRPHHSSTCPSNGSAQSESATSYGPDVAAIKIGTNQSQKKGSQSTEGRVTAMPSSYAIPLPVNTGPNIATPMTPSTSWQPTAQHAMGYGASHQFYNASKQYWASQQYQKPQSTQPVQDPALSYVQNGTNIAHRQSIQLGTASDRKLPAGTLNIQVSVFVEAEGGQPVKPMSLMKEGMLISSDASGSAIRFSIIKFMVPRLSRKYPEVDFGQVPITVLHQETFKDLALHNSYAYGQTSFFDPNLFIHTTGGRTTKSIFKHPLSKGGKITSILWFSLYLSEDFTEVYSTKNIKADSYLSKSGDCLQHPQSSYKRAYLESTSNTSTTNSNNDVASTPKRQKVTSAICTPPTVEESRLLVNTSRADALPAHRKNVNTNIDRSSIRRAVSERGQIYNQDEVKTISLTLAEQLLFYPIIIPHFSNLVNLASDVTSKYLDESDAFTGIIIGGPDLQGCHGSSYLGKGVAKTAHRVTVALGQIPLIGLGASVAANTKFPAVLKRLYDYDKSGRLVRKPKGEETPEIMAEAKTMAWSASLYNYCVDLVQERASKSSDSAINIPNLRFVHSAVAILQGPILGSGPSNLKTTSRATILLEEEVEGEWCKLVNNAYAVPAIDKEHPRWMEAQYLCFLQHLQYDITDGMMFITDWQGGDCLLSDPQIITDPRATSIKSLDGQAARTRNGAKAAQKSQYLFGLGNLPSAYFGFPLDHQCNHYCRWYGLEALEPHNIDEFEEWRVSIEKRREIEHETNNRLSSMDISVQD